MKEIIIIGAGDFAKEVAWLIEGINKVEPTYLILGYLDNDETKIGTEIGGYKVIGNDDYIDELVKHHNLYAVIAMQNVDIKEKLVKKFEGRVRWETLIHPSAEISNTSLIGEGTVICAGVYITVDTCVGKHCLFNISSVVGHDCVIGDYVSIMSGVNICGHVKIGNKAYLATNCTVIPNMKIGEHATVGAGSVVLRNVKDNISVMGVPAKKVLF